MLTQERLKELLTYNPDTGVFTRKRVSRGGRWKVGTLDGTGYIHTRVDYKIYLAHRLAWLYMYGEFPTETIDHINHNKTDNRIKNLRAVSLRENMKNRPPQQNNTSGVIGVSWMKDAKKWGARIETLDKRLNLGCFEDFFEAICVRKSAEIRYNYHENHGFKYIG